MAEKILLLEDFGKHSKILGEVMKEALKTN